MQKIRFINGPYLIQVNVCGMSVLHCVMSGSKVVSGQNAWASGVPRCFKRGGRKGAGGGGGGGADQTEGRNGGVALTNQLGMQKFILQLIY